MATYSDDATAWRFALSDDGRTWRLAGPVDDLAWRFALHGWFQLHDERGALIGTFESASEVHEWARKSAERLRLYRLDYWFRMVVDVPADEGVARVQRRWRIRKTERGSLQIARVPLAGGRKGGAR